MWVPSPTESRATLDAVVAVPVKLPINVVAVTLPVNLPLPITSRFVVGVVVPIPKYPPFAGIKVNKLVLISTYEVDPVPETKVGYLSKLVATDLTVNVLLGSNPFKENDVVANNAVEAVPVKLPK